MQKKVDKIKSLKTTRQIAMKAFYEALNKVLSKNKPIAETDLKKTWLKELRKSGDIFNNGWYVPPPHGITIIFAQDNKPQRTQFRSLRFKENFPQKNIFLNKKSGIIIAYASPVNKETGIIGDFGLTLYFGKRPELIEHIKNILNIQKKVFNHAKIGMSLSELYKYAVTLFKKDNLSNDWWLNITDPSGRNMGHSIPSTEKDWSDKEYKLLSTANNNWEKVANMISKRRIFFSPKEELKIKKGIAFSIECRLKKTNNPAFPVVWFHTVAIFQKNGKKEFLTNFDKLFKLAGMEYALNY